MSFFKEITKPFKKVFKGVGKLGSSLFDSKFGKALSLAALAAGTIYSGGALSGLVGGAAAAGGAAAGAGTAAAAGTSALSSAAGLSAVASAGIQGYQAASAEEAHDKALAEERRALMEKEIIKKKAMLSEMTSVSSRINEARNVRNNLQGMSRANLGGRVQQLGD